jgi:anti-sigma factor RsiW
MDCEAVKSQLVDVLEESAPSKELVALEEHLASCQSCRAELLMLRQGREVLVACLDKLAPAEERLTEERLQGLLRIAESMRERPRIITLRHFVGAAAAAAILVSAYFLYQDIRAPANSGQPSVASQPQAGFAFPSRPGTVRVVLTRGPGATNPDVVMGYVMTAAERREPMPAEVFPFDYIGVVRSSSPGVHVPVQHALYDAEEAGYWW